MLSTTTSACRFYWSCELCSDQDMTDSRAEIEILEGALRPTIPWSWRRLRRGSSFGIGTGCMTATTFNKASVRNVCLHGTKPRYLPSETRSVRRRDYTYKVRIVMMATGVAVVYTVCPAFSNVFLWFVWSLYSKKDVYGDRGSQRLP